jgi:hypothetical protein
MKTNQYPGDREPFSAAYSANDTVDRTDQGPQLDRAEHNRLVGNSPGGAVAAAIASREPFPLRTLIVCFAIWLIATEAMIFDQLKFETRAHLFERQTRSLSGPRVLIPNEQPSDLSSAATVQRL